MNVRIRIPSRLRQVNDPSKVEIDAINLGEAIEKLEQIFPGIKRELTKESGKEISSDFDYYINGKRSYPPSLTTPLKDGDEVIVIPLGIDVGG
jgi:molybdopterin synthase sulfur carrier subunit